MNGYAFFQLQMKQNLSQSKKAIEFKLFFLLILATLTLNMNVYSAQVNGIYYNLNGTLKTAEVTKENQSYTDREITIPETIEISGQTYKVTSIGNYAFSYCSGLKSVTLPESVTAIGEWAFYKCSGLTKITIPEAVTSIGKHAFYQCSGLTSITIPEAVTSIEYSVFDNCSGLKSVNLPESVTEIGKSAFSGCNKLTSITIPEAVTSIGDYAFGGVPD